MKKIIFQWGFSCKTCKNSCEFLALQDKILARFLTLAKNTSCAMTVLNLVNAMECLIRMHVVNKCNVFMMCNSSKKFLSPNVFLPRKYSGPAFSSVPGEVISISSTERTWREFFLTFRSADRVVLPASASNICLLSDALVAPEIDSTSSVAEVLPMLYTIATMKKECRSSRGTCAA